VTGKNIVYVKVRKNSLFPYMSTAKGDEKTIGYGSYFWYDDSEFSLIPDVILDLGLNFAEVSLTYPLLHNIPHDKIQF
jgi:hypothetical protein